jgi:hypothetical protein
MATHLFSFGSVEGVGFQLDFGPNPKRNLYGLFARHGFGQVVMRPPRNIWAKWPVRSKNGACVFRVPLPTVDYSRVIFFVFMIAILLNRRVPRAKPPQTTVILNVYKDGGCIETVNASTKPVHVLGRNSDSCDIVLAHESVSRQHAAIAQDEAGAVFVSAHASLWFPRECVHVVGTRSPTLVHFACLRCFSLPAVAQQLLPCVLTHGIRCFHCVRSSKIRLRRCFTHFVPLFCVVCIRL